MSPLCYSDFNGLTRRCLKKKLQSLFHISSKAFSRMILFLFRSWSLILRDPLTIYRCNAFGTVLKQLRRQAITRSDDNTVYQQVHYGNVIMGAIVSQITRLTIVYSTVYSDADERKHRSSASLAFVRGIHRGPVNSPHKWPVTRKMFPFDDVIMTSRLILGVCPAIERWRYFVTTSFIGWTQT